MKRIDILLAEVRAMQHRYKTVTVCFMDGTHRELPFLDALQLCAVDDNVVDAIAEDETGTSFLRAIIDCDKDLSDLPELAELDEWKK